MRIIGIDPGLKATGFGVVDVHPSGKLVPVDVGCIEPRSKLSLPEKLLKIKDCLDEIIDRNKPQVMVLEKLYAHHAHPTTAAIMGHARGVICYVCVQKGLSLIEESPKRVRKAVVGNGNASKEQTRRAVAQVLKIDPLKLSLDASDALALALGYASMQRFVK